MAGDAWWFYLDDGVYRPQSGRVFDGMQYHMKVDVAKYGGVYLSAKEINELREALEEAVYFLNSTDEDLQKKGGVYGVVSALEMLREKNT